MNHFFLLKPLPVDSLNRVLMVAICFPSPVKFASKKMLVSFENSRQNVDGNSPKLWNEKNSKADNNHLRQLFSIPQSGHEPYRYQQKNRSGNEATQHS